jgi:DNA polymerase-3 subunit beta
LAKTSLNGQTFPAFTPLILPRDFVADLQAIAERAPSLTLDVSETRLRASSDGVSITMKLLGETYGPYENAIDAVAPRRFSASRISIEAAVVRCASLADGIDRTVKLSLRGGVLALSSSRSESGDVSDEIEVGDGKDFDTGFHVRRLQNALTALKSATEVEALFEDGAPMMLRDAAHPEAVQIIAAQRV